MSAIQTGYPSNIGGVLVQRPLWIYIWKLLRLRLVITISNVRRARLARKIGYGALSLVFLSILVLVFVGSWALLRFIRSPQVIEMVGDYSVIIDNVPVALFTAAFIGILLTSFGVLLQGLYLAGDMDFLISAPIPIRAVFVTKLLQAILPNLSLIGLFTLPVLFGLGAASRFNLSYYLFVLLVLISVTLAAAGIASLLVMLIVRFFPARRVAEVLAFFGAIFSMICSQSGYLANSLNFSGMDETQLTRQIGLVSRLNSPLSPFAWAGRGLIDLGAGRWLSGAGLVLLTLIVTWGIFLVCLVMAERLYYTGWASIQVGSRRKKSAPAQIKSGTYERPGGVTLQGFIPPPIRAILVKDWLVIRRDLRNMSQVVTPLILGIIYGFYLLRGGGRAPAGRGEAPAWFMTTLESIIVYGKVGLSLFVGWSLLSRLAYIGFSQEGKNYWILKTAPLSPRQLLLSKYLVAYLPSLVIGWLFLVIITIVQGKFDNIFLFGIPVVALCNAGITGINLAFGVKGTNLKWDDPRHMSSGPMGCLVGLVTLIYLPVSLLMFFSPPIVFAMLGWSETAGQVLGLVAGGVLSLACAIVPPLIVVNHIPRLGEE